MNYLPTVTFAQGVAPDTTSGSGGPVTPAPTPAPTPPPECGGLSFSLAIPLTSGGQCAKHSGKRYFTLTLDGQTYYVVVELAESYVWKYSCYGNKCPAYNPSWKEYKYYPEGGYSISLSGNIVTISSHLQYDNYDLYVYDSNKNLIDSSKGSYGVTEVVEIVKVTSAPTPTPTPPQTPSAGSCQGFCGAKSQSGCWCDSSCVLNNDCCPDYERFCTIPITGVVVQPTPTPVQTTPQPQPTVQSSAVLICDTTAQAIVNAIGGCTQVDPNTYPNIYNACCKQVTKESLLSILDKALGDGTVDDKEKSGLLYVLNAYLS